jgi:hypothetical protein
MSGLVTTATPKSFWAKPEGKTQLAIFAAAGFAIFWFWGTLAPFVLSTIETTAQIAMWAGALFVAGVILTNKPFRTGMWYLYQTFLRKLTGFIIEMDPISILKTYIRHLKEKLEEMWQKRAELEGARTGLQTKMAENAEKADHEFQKALVAREKGMEDAASLCAMRAQGLTDMNAKLAPLLAKMDQLVDFLTKAHKAADYTVKQAEIQVELKEDEYKSIKIANSALRSAMSIFKGDPDRRAVFEQGMEFINDDMAAKLGEIKQIVDFSKDFIDTADLEDATRFDKAMKMLDQYRGGQQQQQLAVLGDRSLIGKIPPAQQVKVLNTTPSNSNSEWQ